MKIEQLSTLSESSDELVTLLNDCVESGASIGFLAPLESGEAERYWRGSPPIWLRAVVRY
nr:hypothetical protein KXZ65_14955 [Pectobacterium sp. PL152]